jgi:lysophospholipase L1-like esterase
VVIFLGGNDLKNDYTEIFNDTLPDSFYTGIVDRIFELRTWLAALDPDVKTVVCTVPDVGVAPSVSQTYNDPALRAAARARIAAMNADLASRAAAIANVEVADIHALTLRIEDETPLKINGTPFTAEGAPENPPDRLFCRDDFHPSTSAQALIANEILRALNRLLGTGAAPLANREILGDVLGLDADQPYLDWIAAQGVEENHRAPSDNPDGDAFDNLAEFAFGLRAGTPDPGLPAEFTASPAPPRLGIIWRPNPEADGYLAIGAERSVDLLDWTPLSPDAIVPLGDGRYRASVSALAPRAFLRATVKPAP